MCRYYQLWGCIILSFGLGILIGMWLEGGFFAHCFGFGLILVGCSMGRKR